MPQVARDERFCSNAARVADREVLDALIAEVFAHLPSTRAVERLEAAGTAYGRMNSIREAAAHPHLRFTRIDTPAGEIRIIAPAAVTDSTACRPGPIPALGEHTEVIRAEYGAGGRASAAPA